MTAFVSAFSTAFRPSFAGSAVASPSVCSRPAAVSMTMSEAVPFLEKPSKLDGTRVGDIGFDPLYLSDYINLDYAAASEIKHGRICMLASLGMLVQEFVHLPSAAFSEANPLKAIYAVPVEGWVQIITVICILELASFKDTYTVGADLGFNPLNFGSPETMDALRLKEIKNGRLAMLATMGFIMQTFITGKPVIAQLGSLGS